MKALLPHEKLLLSTLQLEIDKGSKLRIDVGLSYGMPYTLRWVANDKNVVVMGFEPHIENYQKCEEILASIDPAMRRRIFLFNLALTNLEDFEDLELWATKSGSEGVDTGRSSLLEPQSEFKEWVKHRYLVRTVPIYKLLDNLDFDQIEFVKVDTQGFDLRVLEGFRENLTKILLIMVEADSSKYYQKANSNYELENYLNSFHFRKIAQLSAKSQESESPSDFIFFNSRTTFYRNIPRPIGYHFKHNFFYVLLIGIQEPIGFALTLVSEFKVKLGSIKWKFGTKFNKFKHLLLKYY